MARSEVNVFQKLIIKFENFFLGTQFCENCGRDLSDAKSHGFNELDHCGLGERKICPSCKAMFYV